MCTYYRVVFIGLSLITLRTICTHLLLIFYFESTQGGAEQFVLIDKLLCRVMNNSYNTG